MRKRFVKEYGNFRIETYREVAKDFPYQAEDCERRITRIESVMRAYYNGLTTENEAVRAINEA